MPTLDWIGKKAVVNHHREVPYHLLQLDEELSFGDPDSDNLLVEGDNLLALKALLPYYAGQVKCIFIDPPYNTGNENWVYNDNVNSPEIRRWLGKTVGKEAEDLSRHDKWLCMMLPRLNLLKEFLSEDGAIFVTIDNNEFASLRFLMDEVFGPRNFVSTIAWQKIYTVKNSAKYLSEMHDHIVIYARKKDKWKRNLRPRDESTDEDYSNPDSDPEGPWISHALQSRNKYSKGTYRIQCPGGRVIEGPPSGTYWRVSESKLWKHHEKGEVWWGADGNNNPRIKEYLADVKQGVVPTTWWPYQYAGANSTAKVRLRAMMGDETLFNTPKPVELVQRILELSTNSDSIVLDSFAGSGTTGHAVLAANKGDGGSRRFILVEMDRAVCSSMIATRLKQAAKGYSYQARKTTKRIEGLGGGFRYCRLGSPLFDQSGTISAELSFGHLAAHVFFTQTGRPLPKPEDGTDRTPLLGVDDGAAIYLLFNGILGDKTVDGGNVLTGPVLSSLPPHDGPMVIYGEGCRLGADRLKRERITFKQIRYEIKVA